MLQAKVQKRAIARMQARSQQHALAGTFAQWRLLALAKQTATAQADSLARGHQKNLLVTFFTMLMGLWPIDCA